MRLEKIGKLCLYWLSYLESKYFQFLFIIIQKLYIFKGYKVYKSKS